MDEKQIWDLVQKVNFGNEEEMIASAAAINLLANEKGVSFGSSEALYRKFISGEEGGFVVPAINVRTLTFDFAKLIFSSLKELSRKHVIFELAPTEAGYTNQTPQQFASSITAGAIAAGYTGEIVLQGDHYQFSASKYAIDPETERMRLIGLIDESISVGYRNIDIDASTLVDYQRADISSQQKENVTETLALLTHIRNKYPEKNISVGGEIGHIGDRNTIPEEVEYFLGKMKQMTNGINKVAVQTGTTHGGMIDDNGKNVSMPIDLELVGNLGITAKKFGVAGIVQHGASTLPIDILSQLSSKNVVEAHLSTGWQNIFFDNLSESLKQEMYGYIRSNFMGESKSIWSETEAIYRLRKKVLGPFKEKIWSMTIEEKAPILEAWREFANQLFVAFNLK